MQKTSINIVTEVIFKVVLVALGLWFLYAVRDIVAVFFVSVILMAALEPTVRWFQRRKVNRVLAVTLVYLLLFLIIGISISFMVPAVIVQFQEFSRNLPSYLEGISNIASGLNKYFQTQGISFSSQDIFSNLRGNFGNLFSRTLGVFSGLFSFVVIISMAFYMSVKEDGMEKFFQSITPKIYDNYVVSLAKRIKSKIGKWMLGQILLMVIIFLLDFLVLYLLGVPYALIIAIIGGILEIIPYIGPTVSTIIAGAMGLLFSPIKGLLVIIGYILIQVAENNVFVPQIMKKAVGLNPLAVILALLIGAKIGGVLGAILSVPIATIAGVLIGDWMAFRDASKE
ncbi:MAG: AI-2E family transporter [Candidatus Moranbacteria bacterium]|jgi:predicted PurR-regulated permease PerM|nr:AI-2E family transporter [Candidatus Moranbacteria bacterium]